MTITYFSSMSRLPVIGRQESVEFSELNLGRLEAKIDTGAYRSSIHCRKAEIIQRSGQELLSVQFQIGRRRPQGEFKRFTETVVRSSNGIAQKRFVIHTRIRFGKKKYKVSFTLTDRSEMRSPVLLGRKFLSKKYIVDVSKSHLLDT